MLMKIRMFIGGGFHVLEGTSRGGQREVAMDHGTIILKLQQLFQKENEAFVAEAYREFLDREPDPQGLRQHVRALRAGIPKIAVIAAIVQSDEANRLYHRLAR
jgi:hypothetical protein